MFRGHYDGWNESRMNGIKKYILPDYFKSKTVLELGAGHAHIGNKFSELGAIVTSSDGRREHVATINRIYPHLNTKLIDGDNITSIDNYDIIIHWGLLYHLKEIELHLEKISDKCNVLLLETEVADSDDNSFYLMTHESGHDQALNTIGIRPSPAYVEKILTKNGFNFKLIMDPILNSSFHNYDWEIKNTKSWRHGLRRFWICWKNLESPLIE